MNSKFLLNGLFHRLLIPVAFFSASPAAKAIDVDREILILVDVGADANDFDLILEGIAASFEDQNFLTAVTNGSYGSVAASVVMFNLGGEQVALPWMQLSSTADLQNYADAVRNLVKPNQANVSYASAIGSSAASIASSAFTGTESQITIIDDGTGFYEANPSNAQSARDSALASGVDVINGIVFDAAYRESAITNYYEQNIVSAPENLAVISSPQGGPKSAEDLAELETSIVQAITAGAIAASGNAVPEPSGVALLSLGCFSLLVRRKRS